MSRRSKVEPQDILSYIRNGASQHAQLRLALDPQFPRQWPLETYYNNANSIHGPGFFVCAFQNKNTVALELLMGSLGLNSSLEESQVDTGAAENLLDYAIENYDKQMFNSVLQHIDPKCVFKQRGRDQTKILHTAAYRNIADIFRGLQAKMGSELQNKLLGTRDGQGQTVLHMAASKNTLDAELSDRCYDTVVEILKIEPGLIGAQDKKGETVFHKAVAANHGRVVEHLLTIDAATLSKCDKKGDSAYSFVQKKRVQSGHIENRRDHRGPPRTKSFNEGMGSMIHKAILELDMNIPAMRQLLFKNEPGKVGPELIWDLSWFDTKKMNFTAYLKFIESNNLNVTFYETLKRVTLPDLSCDGNQTCDASNHGLRKSSEARVIFSHLKSKGVKHIIEVVVPDCMMHPHANKHIVGALQPFNVRRLKWRKLDLGVQTIAMAAPEVEGLTLYSSGDRDALSQWVDVGGLHHLSKVAALHCPDSSPSADAGKLSYVQSTLPFLGCSKGEDDDAELEKIRCKCEETLLIHKRHSQQDCSLKILPHNGLLKIEQLPCDCREPRFARSQIKVELDSVPLTNREADQQLLSYQYSVRQDTIFDRMLPLKQFLLSLDTDKFKDDSRFDRDGLKRNPVKVAVLDSGIYADSDFFPNLTGASFIEDITDTDSHWHSGSNPHGFIMASLIRKLDPICHILAARTHHGPDMQGGHVGAAIKDIEALDWAMHHRADIICMSWTCAEDVSDYDVGRLETKLQEAAKSSLIFCTTGDKGPSAKQSYPAGFAISLKISSCSISGQPSTNAEKHNTEFYLPAEDIYVPLPKYLNIGDKIPANGSSAATALAAGLASLVLSLARFAYHGVEDESSPTEAVDSDTDVQSDYSDLYSSALLPAQHQQTEDQVVHLKKRWMMEKVFRYMCYHSEKFVQPWELLPMELIDQDEEDAKKSVAEFIDRAKKHR